MKYILFCNHKPALVGTYQDITTELAKRAMTDADDFVRVENEYTVCKVDEVCDITN